METIRLEHVVQFYIGCEVQTKIKKIVGGKPVKQNGILKEVDFREQAKLGILLENETDDCNYEYLNCSHIKPYLKPLNELTEDNCATIWELIGGTPHLFDFKVMLEWLIDSEMGDYFEGFTFGAIEMGLVIQWLCANRFDAFQLIESNQAIAKTNQ